MAKTSSWLRKITVLLLAFAIVVCYSVIPMNQSYAASKKPKKIAVKATTKTIDIKGQATITVTKVTPEGASKAVKFKSSKKKVAKVSKKGVVTGKKKGTVKITVTSKANKKVKKTIKIKVKNLKPSSIALSVTSATLEPGKTLALTATAAPVGVYAPMEWTSSDPSVATVANGVVTANAAGTATITVATTKAAGKIVTATCNVTVAAPTPAPAPSENVVETPATVGEANIKKLTTTVDMSKYEKGKVVKVWVPVPQTDEYQTITDVDFSAEKANNPRITTEAANGNQMLYLEWGEDVAPADRTATLTYTVKRYEVRRDPASIVEDPAATIPDYVKAYIDKESEYVKVKDPVVQDKAKEIVGEKTATLDKARAIYEWCIANLERIDNGEKLTGPDGVTKEFVVDGCGYGDTVQILKDFAEVGRAGGHCTDINSTFVALCRAAGIPAREMFGTRINSPNGGQHCWAEFYIAGTGWVYADPGDVLKFGVKNDADGKNRKNMTYEEVQAARGTQQAKDFTEYYWCGVDNNRVVLSRGRDITFEPAQAWGVCNTFGYPAAEVGGERLETSFADWENFHYEYKAEEDKTVFVDAAYVKDAVDKATDGTVIAEVSWGPDAPPELIPGAIHVNTDALESNGQDGDFEFWDLRGFENNFDKLGEALAKYGITKDSELICYGWGENNSGVTRLAMAALMMGVKNVKVLEGGTEVWFNAGYEKATAAAEPKSVDSFGAPEHPEWVISTEDMLKKVESDSNFKLVSIRSYDEFIGKNSGYAYIDKAGEPKGAVWGHDTDDGSYFKDGKFVGVDTINEYLKPYGASTDNELAFYCGTGWRATIPFLICYEAGIENMKLWDDGWYVYCGAFADSWNWPTKATPSKAVHPENPVQIGDPAKGAVKETTVGELEPIYNPLRGEIEPVAESVELVPGVPSALGFNIMPAAKPGITNSVIFTSSDENVATVDKEGKVTVKAGAAVGSKATITATGNATFGSTPEKEGSHKTASYTVTVSADKKYADMTPEEWAAVGIDYADVDYTNDFILDVRTAENYNNGHLVGSTNVSVAAGEIADGDEVAKALDQAYIDAAGKRIVVVCNSGQSLAKRAMDYFKTHGADMGTVTYLKGGNKGIAEGEYALNNGIVSAADINLSKDVVVDLRPADMYNSGHIVASKNIDVMTQFTDTEKAALDEQMAAVPEDGKLVLVCIKGIGLAKKATAYLQSAGADMKKVTYLIGGATALADSEYKSMLGVSEVAATDVIVDVRPDSQYVNGRIEGAIECTVSGAITDDQKTALSKVYEDNKDNNIVIVCIKGVGLAKSAMAYLQSIGADMTKVTYLIGGFDTWKAKYPVITQ